MHLFHYCSCVEEKLPWIRYLEISLMENIIGPLAYVVRYVPQLCRQYPSADGSVDQALKLSSFATLHWLFYQTGRWNSLLQRVLQCGPADGHASSMQPEQIAASCLL